MPSFPAQMQQPTGSLPPFNPAPLPPPPPAPQPTPKAGPPPLPNQRTPSTAALEMAVALDASQKKQLKAIRVLLELLIEKGVFSRDEYMALVNRR
jgi:hypothetical protein